MQNKMLMSIYISNLRIPYPCHKQSCSSSIHSTAIGVDLIYRTILICASNNNSQSDLFYLKWLFPCW